MVNSKLLFKDTYKNKKVLITGHTGFKGSWLSVYLNMLGAKVYGFSLKPKENSLYEFINSESFIKKSYIEDINNYNSINKVINKLKPDFIFHLAAQAIVRKSYNEPLETFNTNIIGTVNLLNSLKTLKESCNVIIITTDKVYENKEKKYPYKEFDELGGYDPYSSSKACAEIITNSYRRSFFNLKNIKSHKKAICTVRAGNVIGGGDWTEDRIIPDLVKSFSKNLTLKIRNPNAIRPWQHVIDPIYAYLLIGHKLLKKPKLFSRPWNIGPNIEDTLSVREMVDICSNHWPNKKIKYLNEDSIFHEANLLMLDISDSKNILKWSPKLDVNESIELTINWYKNFYNGGNPYQLVLNDLLLLNEIK